MLTQLLCNGSQTEQLEFSHLPGRLYIGEFWLSKGEGSGLVKGHGVDLCHGFDRRAFLHQAASQRGIADRGDQRCWRCQHHDTRAEYNQDGDSAQDIPAEPPDQCTQYEGGRCIELSVTVENALY